MIWITYFFRARRELYNNVRIYVTTTSNVLRISNIQYVYNINCKYYIRIFMSKFMSTINNINTDIHNGKNNIQRITYVF